MNEFVGAVQMVQTEFAKTFNDVIGKGYPTDAVMAAVAVTLGRVIAVLATSPEDMQEGLQRAAHLVDASARERWQERQQ